LEDALGQHITYGVLDVAWVTAVINCSGQSWNQADLLVNTTKQKRSKVRGQPAAFKVSTNGKTSGRVKNEVGMG